MKKAQLFKIILASLITAGTLSACDIDDVKKPSGDDFVTEDPVDGDDFVTMGLIPNPDANDNYDGLKEDDGGKEDEPILMGDVPYELTIQDEEYCETEIGEIPEEDDFVKVDPVNEDASQEVAKNE